MGEASQLKPIPENAISARKSCTAVTANKNGAADRARTGGSISALATEVRSDEIASDSKPKVPCRFRRGIDSAALIAKMNGAPNGQLLGLHRVSPLA